MRSQRTRGYGTLTVTVHSVMVHSQLWYTLTVAGHSQLRYTHGYGIHSQLWYTHSYGTLMVMVYYSGRIQIKSEQRKGTWSGVREKPGTSFRELPSSSHTKLHLFLSARMHGNTTV